MIPEGSFIGVDPGAKGAIALLSGKSLLVFDIPMQTIRRGKTKKPITDKAGLSGVARLAADLYPGARVCIEKVWGVTGQGASSGAALGHARASLEWAFYVAFRAEPELISPQRWKSDMGLMQRGPEDNVARGKTDKKKSLALALQLFPEHAALFAPVRGVRNTEQCIGRAEAALIAKWAQENP